MHNVFHFQSDLYAVTFTLNLYSTFEAGRWSAVITCLDNLDVFYILESKSFIF